MSRRSTWVVPAALGAAAGFAAAWWLSRPHPAPARSPGPGELDTSWTDRWGERVDAAVDAATGGLRAVERRWWPARPIDLAFLRAAMNDVPGTDRLLVSVLGGGLVEIEGVASDEAVAGAREALLRQEGVRKVINRVWTPSSADPGTN